MMVGRTRFVLVFAAALVLSTGLTLAQPTFNPNGGLFGPQVPGVIDEDRDGPDSGDRPVWPSFAQSGVIQINHPCGPALIGATSSGGAGAGVLDEYSYNGQFMVDQLSGGAPVGGSFDDGNTQGGLDVEDPQGDGVYDRFRLTSTNTFFDDVLLPFQLQDTSGDGVADYAGVGGLSTLIGGGCQGFDSDDPMWVPLAPTGPNTKSVVLDLDGDGQPDPVFLAGPPLVRTGIDVPTLGEWGLLLLVLSLVGVSLRLLRLRS